MLVIVIEFKSCLYHTVLKYTSPNHTITIVLASITVECRIQTDHLIGQHKEKKTLY